MYQLLLLRCLLPGSSGRVCAAVASGGRAAWRFTARRGSSTATRSNATTTAADGDSAGCSALFFRKVAFQAEFLNILSDFRSAQER